MRKRLLRIAIISCILLLAAAVGWLYWQSDRPQRGSSELYRTTRLKLDDRTLVLDIADSPAKQQLGLGKRASLAADRGMVFSYDDVGQRCFWMKDMHFAIDILWLDAQKQVGHIEKSVAPDTYPQTFCPNVAAQYVVELPAGMADTLGIKPGDALLLEL